MKLNFVNPKTSNLKFEIITFPDGQPHLKLAQPRGFINRVEIVISLRNPNDLFILAQARDILEAWGVQETNLTITYLLAARMDRRMSINEAFSAKIVTEQLDYRYNKITVFDPHSVVSASMMRASIIDQEPFINRTLELLGEKVIENLIFCAPDSGAYLKVKHLADEFKAEAILATKTRNPEDGTLGPPKLHGDIKIQLKGSSILIIDDICDGGRTFIQLYELLKSHGVADVYLAVSHGIFSQGLPPLAMFKQIFTTNSYTSRTSGENLTVIELF